MQTQTTTRKSNMASDLPPISGTNIQYEPKKTQKSSLSDLPMGDLLALREQIDSILPKRGLRDINLEDELVLQLEIAQKLQKDTLSNFEIPANQMAQCVGQVAAALTAVAKLQIDIHDSERLKRIESILIECISTLPTETQEAFFSEYERKLG